MKSRPIIFTGESIPQILARDKTMTRRVMKTQPPDGATEVRAEWVHGELVATYRAFPDGGTARHAICACPYAPGDKLWVKEAFTTKYDRGSTWVIYDRVPGVANHISVHGHVYAKTSGREMPDGRHSPRWMSRGLCRIHLEVLDVRAQRVADITEEDAIAEGGGTPEAWPYWPGLRNRLAFSERWDKLNAQRGYPWANNDWVFALTFKLLDGKESANG